VLRRRCERIRYLSQCQFPECRLDSLAFRGSEALAYAESLPQARLGFAVVVAEFAAADSFQSLGFFQRGEQFSGDGEGPGVVIERLSGVTGRGGQLAEAVQDGGLSGADTPVGVDPQWLQVAGGGGAVVAGVLL
jgi:hypothetical protein